MVFGDLHYDELPDGDRRVDELLTHIKQTKPQFVVSLGDLCRPVQRNKEAVLEKFSAAGVTLYHMLGNHETDACHLENALEFLSLKSPYYSFQYGNVKFIVLNSCYLRKDGKEEPYYSRNYKEEAVLYPVIPSDEIEWLKKELNDGKQYVIFSHHSLINQFGDRGIYNREEIRSLFEGKNVRLCMNGHDHGDDFSVVEGILYYTVNSAAYVWCGSQIASSESLREKYGYLNGFLFYKQALYVDVEMDDNEIRISGMNGEYLSVAPENIGLYDYRWNGVSIEAKTSSCVINRNGT